MRIAGSLALALDFRGAPVGTSTTRRVYRDEYDTWHIQEDGPTYSNVYRIFDHDDEGLAWLKAHDETDSVSDVPE